MRTIRLLMLTTLLGIIAVTGEVSAQYRPISNYPYSPYPRARPYFPGYVPPAATSPNYGYLLPTYDPGVANGVGFIRSLYHHYLNREPDAPGMQGWLNRLAQLRGDTQRLTQEFANASRNETFANNPALQYPGYP